MNQRGELGALAGGRVVGVLGGTLGRGARSQQQRGGGRQDRRGYACNSETGYRLTLQR